MEQRDPRMKLTVACIFACAALWATSPAGLGLLSFLVAATALASRVQVFAMVRRLRSVLWFVIIIGGINAFTRSGEVVWEFAGVIATREGLEAGGVLSLRIVLLLSSSLVFVQTTSIPEMMDGLETLLQPIRRFAGPVLQVIAIALNFVPLLIHTARRIKMMQIARGADVERRFIGQIRFARSATLPLFVSAFRGAEQLALAMEARGYDPMIERSHYGELRMQTLDWICLFAVLTGCIVAVLI